MQRLVFLQEAFVARAAMLMPVDGQSPRGHSKTAGAGISVANLRLAGGHYYGMRKQ